MLVVFFLIIRYYTLLYYMGIFNLHRSSKIFAQKTTPNTTIFLLISNNISAKSIHINLYKSSFSSKFNVSSKVYKINIFLGDMPELFFLL